MAPTIPSELASKYGFVFCCIVAALLTDRCLTPPNASTSKSATKDAYASLFKTPHYLRGRRFINIALWCYHAYLAFSYPGVSHICPQKGNLNYELISWNSYTIACLAVICAGVLVRLLAFAQLGDSFTFNLVPPKKLITTGIYAFVQHPSYPAGLAIFFGNVMLLLRVDGLVGCWMPQRLIHWKGMGQIGTISILLLFVLACVGLRTRVMEEEEMLHKEFGTQWEEYHRKTKRVIPYIF